MINQCHLVKWYDLQPMLNYKVITKYNVLLYYIMLVLLKVLIMNTQYFEITILTQKDNKRFCF